MAGPSRFRLISCAVFQRELSIALGLTPNLVDPEFLEISLHEQPEILRAAVQARVDAVSEYRNPSGKAYDAILLGYGLCGNGLAGLEARGIPLVLPRAHDCCTILLGSRSEFLARFGESLSAPWSSTGYFERGTSGFRDSDEARSMGIGQSYATLVEEYGEENAAYVWEPLHPDSKDGVLRYIELEETAALGHAETLRARAAAEGKKFLLLHGSSRLLAGLVAGDWDRTEYLFVPPGARIQPLWDHERIFDAV